MKTHYLFLLLILLTYNTKAQHVALLSYYFFDGMVLNPAYAGNRECLSIGLMHRTQWIGFEGAPQTSALTIQNVILDKKTGVGLTILHDKYGITNATRILPSFAYRIAIQKGMLAFGLAGGVSIVKNNNTKIVLQNEDDPLFANSSTIYSKPDFAFGAFYYNKLIFASLSVPEILSHQYNSESNKMTIISNPKNFTYLLSGGAVIKISQNFKLKPFVMLRYNYSSSSKQIDIAVSTLYRERFALGMMLRTTKAISGMLEFKTSDKLRIAYSIDFDLSPLAIYNKTSHELWLRYDFGFVVDVMNPRNF